MRALAEYVMKGRTQAVLVAVFATGSVLFAWVGAAVVALVTLRKGVNQGSQVLLWAMVPAVVLAGLAATGDTGPATTLLGVMLVASVLRLTASWALALLAAAVSGVITALLMATVGQGYIEEILRILTEALAPVVGDSEQLEAVIPTPMKVAGLLGLSNAFVVTVSLILARWWQSLLYNPGGFGAEFRLLRIPPQLTVLLLVAGAGLSMVGADFRLWALIFAVPLMFAGIALAHGLVAKRRLSNNWLVVFYLSCLLLDPVKMLLLVVAIADSWLNIRERVASR